MMTPNLPFANPDEVGMSSERLKLIQPMIRRYMDQQWIPGAVTMVARQGKIVHFEVQGFQNVEKQVPPDQRHHFSYGLHDQTDNLRGLDDAL